MECYATDLTLSFRYCYYFPLWVYDAKLGKQKLFPLSLPCTTVLACQPEAIGHFCVEREREREKERDKDVSLSPLSLSKKNSLFIKNYETCLIRGRKSIRVTQSHLIWFPIMLVTTSEI